MHLQLLLLLMTLKNLKRKFNRKHWKDRFLSVPNTELFVNVGLSVIVTNKQELIIANVANGQFIACK